VDPATERLVERMGRYFEAEGATRVAGRLFGYLMFQSRPRSLDELAEELQVSKTSISTNARLLEQWGQLELVTQPGDRRDYYVVGDPTRSVELRLALIRQLKDIYQEAQGVPAAADPVVRERLEAMHAFVAEVHQLLAQLLERRRG
jgi:DNA-binding transcriptional regulator GbsR (MarR family)